MNESMQMVEARQMKGLALAESWSNKRGADIRGFENHKTVNFMEGLENASDWDRATVAQLLENTHNWLRGMEESTRTLNVGSFEKFVFPILRAVMANLVVQDLVTVSALDAPTGLLFYFDAIFGSNKGNIRKGDKANDVRRGPSQSYNYSGEVVEEEPLSTGTGATAVFGGGASVLGYKPVRAGTLTITDGTQVVNDNGNGALVGDIGAGTNTINYATGAYTVTFAANPDNGAAITATYEYNSEANVGTPEVDIQLTSAMVTARTQKLRANWSLEAQQDFQSYHGVNAETEIVAFIANLIAKEINYGIIRHIDEIADAGSVTWDRTPPAGVPWIWHKESLYDAFVQDSNLIFSRTQRALGNKVVAGVGVCNVIETLSKFKGEGSGSGGGAGIVKIGKFGDFDIYKHPGMPGRGATPGTNCWWMGHKGDSFLDTGYIWAPYLAAFTTGTIVLDDMIARKAMGSRNARKVVNAGMFAQGELIQSGGAFQP